MWEGARMGREKEVKGDAGSVHRIGMDFGKGKADGEPITHIHFRRIEALVNGLDQSIALMPF